jgi:ribosomal-protein-alanine N-acetyltransferase
MRRFAYESTRLVVRPLRLSDYPALKRAYTQSRPAQNIWDKGPLTEKKCSRSAYKKILLRHRKLAQVDECYIFAAFRRTGELIGFSNVYINERGMNEFGSIGYQIFDSWWGKGLGSELVKTVQRIGHHDLKLKRLKAVIAPTNRRSIALARKTGFYREGVRKEFGLGKGVWLDYAI